MTLSTPRVIFILLAWGAAAAASGANFTTGAGAARKYGVHEISLEAAAVPDNPFEVACHVTFTRPAGGDVPIRPTICHVPRRCGNCSTIWDMIFLR